jgi:hypothetical protein
MTRGGVRVSQLSLNDSFVAGVVLKIVALKWLTRIGAYFEHVS